MKNFLLLASLMIFSSAARAEAGPAPFAWRSATFTADCAPGAESPFCAARVFVVFPGGEFRNEGLGTTGTLMRWQARPIEYAAQALAATAALAALPMENVEREPAPWLVREQVELELADGTRVLISDFTGATGITSLRGDFSAAASLRLSISRAIVAGDGPNPH